MTDGNTYAINKHLDEREDYDALQEVTAELEQAEADNIMLIGRIEELEFAVRYEVDLAQQALDAREELEAKLDQAQWLLCDALIQLREGKIETRRNRADLIDRFLAELKGE